MKFATYSLASLALGSTDAFFVRPPNQRPGFNWHSTHELSRGTADMPPAYDPNYSPPNPLTADTIIDTSGQCSMNPFIFLAVIDSNYGDDAKFSLFGSRNADYTLAENSGATNDGMWMSLVKCANSNINIRKLMAIDALAAKRADVIESILETSVDVTEGVTHQKIKDVLFNDPLEFYKNFWKYNEFVRVFDNTRFSKWSRINALLKIVGDSESPATRYRDRKYLMENLKDTPFQYNTQVATTKYLPAYNGPMGNRAPWSRHNFLASQWNSPWYKPSGYVPLANQQGSETRRSIPMQSTADNFVPLVEREDYLPSVNEITEEQAASLELAFESQE